MIGRRLAGIGLLGFACAQALAAPAPEVLRRWDARLQQLALAPASQRHAIDRDLAAHAPDAAQLRRIAIEDPALAPKLAALTLLDHALREGQVAQAPIDFASAVSILLDGPGAPGSTCAEPLRLEQGQVLRVAADRVGAQGYWLEVRARALRPLILSTRGSRADLRLAAYLDCRETDRPAAAVADDNFGLQADLGLAPRHADQFWRVHVTSADDGEGVLSLLGGEFIRGRVTREAGGQAISGVSVATFNASGNFVASTGAAADGSYQLPVYNGPGTYFARTGQYFGDTTQWLHEAYGGAYCSLPDPYYLASCTEGTLLPIAVPADGIAENIDFALGLGAGVQGRVLDAQNGLPVRDAAVSLYSNTAQLLRTNLVDAAGRYRITGLLPGSVRLSATANTHRGELHQDIPCDPNGACPVLTALPVPIAMGAVATIDFALDGWSSVAATVDYGAGTGVGTLVVVDTNGIPVGSGYVGGSGVQRGVAGPLRPGTYRAYFRGEANRFSQVHGGIDCLGDCGAQIAQGTPIVVSGYGQQVEIAFTPRTWPRVSGIVTDTGSGLPLEGVQLQLAAGSFAVDYRTTASNGGYTMLVPPGSFLVHAGSAEHRNEAYPDAACESPYPPSACVGATPFVSNLQASDATWNFALQRSARISGRLSRLGQPITFDAYVRPLDAARQPLDGVIYVAVSGDRYRVVDIPAGAYTFGASNYQSFAQLYPGIDCPSPQNFIHPWVDCNHAAAQVRTLADGEAVDGIDFDLRANGARRGRVLRADTLAPIPGVAIDQWNAQGDRVAVTVSDQNGDFGVAGSGSGGFALSSDAPGPYIDQVYNGIACPNGSAYEGLCALTGATYVPLPNFDPGAPLLEFRLAPIDPIFANAFD